MLLEEHQALTKYGKAIVNTLQEPLIILGQDFKVLFANPAFYDKFFVSEEDTINKEIFSLGSGQWDIPEFRKLLNEVLSQKTSFNNYEVTHEFPKVGARTMLLNARMLSNGDHSEAILLVITDITERKAAEHGLLLSEVRYRKLFETAKDGILLIDPITEKIIDANPFLLEMLGFPLDEIVGKKLWEIGALKDINTTKTMFQELQAKGYVRYEDLPIQSKDGQKHEVEFVSNRYPIDGTEMIQCNIRDITDRKTAEAKAAMYLDGLEKLNKMMTGREIKMAELKNEIEELKKKIIQNG